MPEWLLGGLIGVFSAGIAWGAIATRVSRVERDVMQNITRELFEQYCRVTNEKLDKLERSIERISEKLDERTGSHRIPQKDD